MIRPALLAAAALLLLPREAPAQLSRHLSGGAGVGSARYAPTAPPSAPEALSGVLVEGSGALSFGAIRLEGFYREGRLAPDSGSAPERDLVDGGLFLAVRPARWASVGGGVRARAFVLPSGTVRWVLPQLRARLEGALVGDASRMHVEGWFAVGASVNVGQADAEGRGGEVGLTVRLARAPVWGRLSYGVDRLASGPRTETLETFTLAVGLGGR